MIPRRTRRNLGSRRENDASPHARGDLSRSITWGIADQAFSSLTNFALGVFAARASNPEQFGAFGVAFSIYVLCVAASRFIATHPLSIRFADRGGESWRHGVAAATGTAVTVAVAFSFVLLCGALVAGGPLKPSLALLAAGLPGLVLQDAWRYVAFSAGRGSLALVNDMVWAAVLFPILAVLELGASVTISLVLAAWVVSAWVAAIVGLWQFRVLPKPTRALLWVRVHRDLVARFMGEFAATAAEAQLALLIVGGAAGLSAVAAIRGGLLVLGPLNVLFMGLGIALISAGARLVSKDLTRFVGAMRLIGILSCAVAAGWALTVVLSPDWVKRGLLGASWRHASEVLLPLGVFMAGYGAALGARVGLKSLGAAKRSLTAQVAASIVTLLGALVGVLAAGARGAAWGMATAQVAAVVCWTWNFSRAVQEAAAEGEEHRTTRLADAPRGEIGSVAIGDRE